MQEFISKINKNIYAKIGIIALLACVFLFLAVVITIKFFVSYSYLENKIQDITGLKLEFVEPKSSFDYKFNFSASAKEINVYNKEKTSKFLTLQEPKIVFKPIGFLFNKAYFKKIGAKNITLNISRDTEGKIDILNSINSDIFKQFATKKITLTRLDSSIENIDIFFNDEYKIKSNIKLNLNNTLVNISKRKKQFSYSQKGTIETFVSNKKQTANLLVEIKSKYPLSRFSSDKLDLNIDLDNINLFMFNDLAKEFISKDIEQINGKAQFEIKTKDSKQELSLMVNNPTLKLKDGKIISPYKKPVVVESLLDVYKDKIEIINSKIFADELSVAFKGMVLNPFSLKPNIDIDVDIKGTEFNKFVYFIPDNAIFYRPKGIPILKKSNFFGKLNGDFKLKLLPLHIEGNLKAQNVHIPEFPKSYRQNDVNVRFMGNKARIFTRVYTPDNEYVVVDGVSNLDDSLYGKYSVKSTSKIDLAFAQKYLVPIQQIIGFNIGPVPIMDISGYGNINIDTQGTLNDAQIFGEFSAYQASARIDGLDAKLVNGDCKLIFDDRNLIFKEIKGKLDDADFLLTGLGNTKGEVKLNAKIDNANTGKILKIFNNSILSKPYLSLTKNIVKADGDFIADIDLIGTIKDYESKEFFEDLAPSGKIILKNNLLTLTNNILVNKFSGMLEFGQKQHMQFDFNLNNSNFSFDLNSKDSLDKIIKNKKAEINSELFSNKIASVDIISIFKNADFLSASTKNIISEFEDIKFYSKLFLKSSGLVSIENIDTDALKALKHNGYIIGLNSSEIKDVKFNSGIIKVVNNKAIFDNLSLNIKNGLIKAKGSIADISNPKTEADLVIQLKDISLDKLNKIFPKFKASNGFIKNGSIIFKGKDVKFNSISMDYGSTPIFLNAKIKDIYNLKILEADFSTIVNEASCDNMINPYLVSPVKIVGEIPIQGFFKGNEHNYFIDFSAIIPKNSDISFSGANLGDVNHKREIQGKVFVNDDVATINNLKLINYIANQNNKVNEMTAIKVDGQILQKDKNILYNNLKVATNTPINVRVLNLLFKKSILKKGNFDCNITLNGDVKEPKINGKITLHDLDIPLYSAQINNIKIAISNKFIDGEITAKNKQSDVKINFHALNKLSAPYVIKDVIVYSNKVDILDALNSITPNTSKADISSKHDFSIKPEDVIIEKGSFDFKELQYGDIMTQNLKGNLAYKNNVLNLANLAFDIAQGKIIALGNYDIKTTKLDLGARMDGCDSNVLATSFLGLPNQIFGKMNGTVSLTAKNLNTPQGIKNIKSDIDFSINNGKMPKLGSLEYLLRAGNLFKNGILGLSLNNIIEVLTPYKTGEFEKISGNLKIANGEIEDLNILSQGKNLSLFLEGNYSLLESFADIKIYGKLSQSISNALGALGNASISQFVEFITQSKKERNEKDIELQNKLEKIPTIEVENPEPRYFKAKVLGDINKDNYIKNFDWI